MEDYKSIMTPPNSKNFHVWIKKVKGVAKKSKVWEYVDPDGDKEEPVDPMFLQVLDYMVEEDGPEVIEGSTSLTQPVKRPARKFADLDD